MKKRAKVTRVQAEEGTKQILDGATVAHDGTKTGAVEAWYVTRAFVSATVCRSGKPTKTNFTLGGVAGMSRLDPSLSIMRRLDPTPPI